MGFLKNEKCKEFVHIFVRDALISFVTDLDENQTKRNVNQRLHTLQISHGEGFTHLVDE